MELDLAIEILTAEDLGEAAHAVVIARVDIEIDLGERKPASFDRTAGRSVCLLRPYKAADGRCLRQPSAFLLY